MRILVSSVPYPFHSKMAKVELRAPTQTYFNKPPLVRSSSSPMLHNADAGECQSGGLDRLRFACSRELRRYTLRASPPESRAGRMVEDACTGSNL